MNFNNNKRFVHYDERTCKSDLNEGLNKTLQYIKNNMRYKNIKCQKDAISQVIYSKLINELKPKTILEFGTLEGGSTLLFDDICSNLNLSTKIYTFDINIKRIKIKESNNIKINKYEAGFPEKYLKDIVPKLEHPILVIEDAHRGIPELLIYLDTYLKKNDYIIIEDTIHGINIKGDKNLYEPYFNFMKENKDFSNKYYIDTEYSDCLGYNHNYFPNSILKKM